MREVNFEATDALAATPPRSYKRLWCAFASALIPGLGDWPLGQRRRATVFSVLLAALLACYWPLRLPRFYWPLMLIALAIPTLNILSASLTFFRGRSDGDSARNLWVIALVAIAILSASIENTLWLRFSGFRAFTIESSSMEPTADQGDEIVVDTWYFRSREPERGDVIAFCHHGIYLVKRIIAVGGDTIAGTGGRVEVDGETLTESYIVHRDSSHEPDERDDFGPVKVPKGELFVMGDNRDFSLDSRMPDAPNDFGSVYTSDVVGKPLYRFRHSVHRAEYDGHPIE